MNLWGIKECKMANGKIMETESKILNDYGLNYPNTWKKAALFIPIRGEYGYFRHRSTESYGLVDDLEILMIRRAMWNPKKNRPHKYPGEWTFPGGHFDPRYDKNLEETATREFEEETGYSGEFHFKNFFMDHVNEIFDEMYIINSYIGKLDLEAKFEMNGNEVMDIGWFNPDEIVDYIVSSDFDKLLKADYSLYGIESERRMPELTLELLKDFKQKCYDKYFMEGFYDG